MKIKTEFLTADNLKDFEKLLHNIIENTLKKEVKKGIRIGTSSYTIIESSINNIEFRDEEGYDTPLGGLATYIDQYCKEDVEDKKRLPQIFGTFDAKLCDNVTLKESIYKLKIKIDKYKYDKKNKTITFISSLISL